MCAETHIMILVQSLALLASATEMADVTEDGILDRILRVEISLDKLGRGERPAGRAELLAKKGGIWAHAASAGSGADP